jgi:hypothetical protein
MHQVRISELESLPKLTTLQAIELLELLDNLQYTFFKMAFKEKQYKSHRLAEGARLGDQLIDLAKEHDICYTCYQPGHVCTCGREFDGWWNAEEMYESTDDILCWID